MINLKGGSKEMEDFNKNIKWEIEEDFDIIAETIEEIKNNNIAYLFSKKQLEEFYRRLSMQSTVKFENLTVTIVDEVFVIHDGEISRFQENNFQNEINAKWRCRFIYEDYVKDNNRLKNFSYKHNYKIRDNTLTKIGVEPKKGMGLIYFEKKDFNIFFEYID